MSATSENRLRAELVDSFKNRAMLYWTLYRELSTEIGPERAEAVLGRAIRARGRQVGEAAAYARFGPADAVAAGEAFLAASPDGGRVFPSEVERQPDGLDIRITRCPLQDAWREAGLAPDQVATLCRIAGRFDEGVFEATGISLVAETWQPGRTGCCRLHLTAR